MLQTLKKSVMFFVLILAICLMLPCSAKAATAIAGGDSLETAVEISQGVEYITTNADGWFKIKTPENVDYIGIGSDQFTNVSVTDSEGRTISRGYDNIYKEDLWNEGNTTYVNYNEKTYQEITDNTYYYLRIYTTKADNCGFKVICTTAYDREHAQTINMNQDYSHKFYTAKMTGRTETWYKFVAPTTGYYKAIVKSSNGSADCTMEYKDGTVICYTDSNGGRTAEVIFEVKKGMTYYIALYPYNPANVTLHVSNVRVSGISLNASSLDLDANEKDYGGEQYLLEAAVSPATAVIQTVTYSSSNPSVATVSKDGWVTAIKQGTTVITATADDGSGVKQTCSVRVRESMYSGQTATTGGIKYKVTSNTSKGGKVSVYGISNKKASSCTIPASIQIKGYTYKVEGIDSNAFANCSKLKTVKGASNITSIGSKAFYKCVKLTTIGNKNNTVSLSKVKTIGNSAFYGCKAIKIVNISSATLTKIGDAAFQGCTSMTSFTAKSAKLTFIGKNAFNGDGKLSTISLKTSKLTKAKIGANAFKGIKSTCTFKVPSKSVKTYKKIFVTKGAGDKIKVKKG